MALSNSGNRYFTLSLHILAWVVVFGLPLLFTIGESTTFTSIFRRSWLPLIFSAIIFYINYLILTDFFFFRKKMLMFFLMNILLVGIFVWLNHELLDFLHNSNVAEQTSRKFHKSKSQKGVFLYKNGLFFVLSIVAGVSTKIYRKWTMSEALKKEAETEKLNTDLNLLKYQLQPHFFFNSLNNIYALVDIAPEKAKESIHGMSKLMRYLLYETKPEYVPLSSETEFLKKYIELMKLRIPEKTRIDYTFPVDTARLMVPPLLFLPLIENAFKHGVSAMEPTFINFEMELRDEELTFKAENTNLPKAEEDKSGSGIGLENLKKRLELIFPGKHQFYSEIDAAVYKCILKISLKRE